MRRPFQSADGPSCSRAVGYTAELKDVDGPVRVYEVRNEEEENFTVMVCISSDWEHVGVRRNSTDELPTWWHMQAIKELFWLPEETVVQFHPADELYVNTHPLCLHLWRHRRTAFPVPEKELV